LVKNTTIYSKLLLSILLGRKSRPNRLIANVDNTKKNFHEFKSQLKATVSMLDRFFSIAIAVKIQALMNPAIKVNWPCQKPLTKKNDKTYYYS
jgi:hypothetical protein